jgi:hypothetical protein
MVLYVEGVDKESVRIAGVTSIASGDRFASGEVDGIATLARIATTSGGSSLGRANWTLF